VVLIHFSLLGYVPVRTLTFRTNYRFFIFVFCHLVFTWNPDMAASFTFEAFKCYPSNHTHGAIPLRISTYLLILVSDYFPSKYVLTLVGASDKAFQHKEGIMVLEDLESGELTEVEPIINK
jgi:hypothetical protein